MGNIVILGAGSFIAKALVLEMNNYLPIKAVTHQIPNDKHQYKNLVTWYEVDILVPKSLDNIISSGDIVINFIHLWNESKQTNLLAIKNILDSCQHKKIFRLLHCSSIRAANFFSKTYTPKIIERFTTQYSYKHIKYEIDEYINRYPLKVFETVIFRPTSIIGPSVKNYLFSLLIAREKKPIYSYLRASVSSNRCMHYVSCEKVVAFIKYLTTTSLPLNYNTYTISSEFSPFNTFIEVENLVFKLHNIKARKIPLLPIPKKIMNFIFLVFFKQASMTTSENIHAKISDFSFNENIKKSLENLFLK
jgi:nucleoside-diphosphate-sugar epimerase